MIPFLKHVANDLYEKMGHDMSQLIVVFPNKRAGIFLNEYLISCNEGSESSPIWAPRYQTINDLFESLSSFTIVDKIEAVCRIYKIYVEKTQSKETLDFFYGWGERLLADFDDIDKNRADADKLFQNIYDIKKIDEIGSISDAQEQALKSFFSNFSVEKNSNLKRKYLELWNVLGDLYHELNHQLKSCGLAYEGALFRNVVDNLEKGCFSADLLKRKYAFVGFNVLDKVETALFSFLKEKGIAWFYWDYDVFYTDRNSNFEAGVFLRQNLELFPNELPEKYFSNFLKEKDIEIVSSPSENAQVHNLSPWLKSNLTRDDEKQTAVVLCNESLIQPLLHCIPEDVKEVNITKGYPVVHTIVYRLLEQKMVEETLKNGTSNALWLKETMESLQNGASEINKNKNSLEKTLNTEAFFLVYTVLNRFYRLIDDNWLNLERATLFKLIKQVVRQLSVPFHGEPAAGLQIMGVLETRCLDFKNIIMMSVGEGFLPGIIRDNSFIPYNLRREFGLTTMRHKVAVYAYYFYRLIQRAKKIRLIYNASTVGNGVGEMSRFLTQLLIESPLKIKHISLVSSPQVSTRVPTAIPKPLKWIKEMRTFSPSAINAYMRCQLQFYFNRVAKIKAPQNTAVVIEPNVLGSVFHRTAELFYNDFLNLRNGRVTSSDLESFLQLENDASIVRYIHRAMSDENVEPNMLVEQIVKSFFKQLIKNDVVLGNFKIVALESPQEMTIDVDVNGVVQAIKLVGNIDRMDIISNPEINEGRETLRIVDYKTGGKMESASCMEDLFTPGENHPHYILQTFVYTLMVKQCENRYPMMPGLFFVNKYGDKKFTPYIKYENKNLEDFTPLSMDFETHLKNLLSEILDESKPFRPTMVTDRCKNCDYHLLCYGK